VPLNAFSFIAARTNIHRFKVKLFLVLASSPGNTITALMASSCLAGTQVEALSLRIKEHAEVLCDSGAATLSGFYEASLCQCYFLGGTPATECLRHAQDKLRQFIGGESELLANEVLASKLNLEEAILHGAKLAQTAACPKGLPLTAIPFKFPKHWDEWSDPDEDDSCTVSARNAKRKEAIGTELKEKRIRWADEQLSGEADTPSAFISGRQALSQQESRSSLSSASSASSSVQHSNAGAETTGDWLDNVSKDPRRNLMEASVIFYESLRLREFACELTSSWLPARGKGGSGQQSMSRIRRIRRIR
jgi:hypothetical protein